MIALDITGHFVYTRSRRRSIQEMSVSVMGPQGNEAFRCDVATIKSDLAIIKSDLASLKRSMVRLQWGVGFNMMCCFYLVAKAYLP